MSGKLSSRKRQSHRFAEFPQLAKLRPLLGALRPGSSDGRAATLFRRPDGIAIDAAGDLYAMGNAPDNTIRRALRQRAASTLARSPGEFDLQMVPAARAILHWRNRNWIALGNAVVADRGNATIRRVTPVSVLVTTVAGVPLVVDARDECGPDARFTSAAGIALDPSGSLFVADNASVRKTTPAGVVTTPAGRDRSNGSRHGVSSESRFGSVVGLAIEAGRCDRR